MFFKNTRALTWASIAGLIFSYNAVYASSYNIAAQAKVTVSSVWKPGYEGQNSIDQRMRINGVGEWASSSSVTFWGEIDYPWLQLDWQKPTHINKIILYDRPTLNSHTASGILRFSDGSAVPVFQIPNDGSPRVVEFPSRKVEWVRFEVTDGDGPNLGLSEIEVFPAPEDYKDYISWVDPYIESARGRYFFFITGNQPFGMIGAAPLTRNKNQYGGGYNYNSTEVLGFPQVHGWMLSGLTLMPTTGVVDPTQGEEHWKSPFSHDGELVQPGYHRMFLERYGTMVEQTATERTSIYRLTYSEDTKANILLNLGGYVSTTTMVNAYAKPTGAREVSGYFDTEGRLWGGPDRVRIFFVMEIDKDLEAIDGWSDKTYLPNVKELQGPNFSVPRNAGMSYSDAPTAGIAAKLNVRAGDQVQVKMAISYVSMENAKANLLAECPGWDFDAVRAASQQEWNAMLGRVDVKGGTVAQKTKFYTDVWHTILGRHKLDDVNGQYPDYTRGGTRVGAHTKNAKLTVQTLPKDKNGKSLFHMYNSDAFWLTQWNLNTWWGLAYPEVLDDFAASLLQYDTNGGLLPRGPNAGGYSYIMTGCPATSLITSAFQKKLTQKWEVNAAFDAMKRNHEQGGMLALDMDDQLAFYTQNGYCPENAGITIQWAFEDWALAQMAGKLGRTADQDYFAKRAGGWPSSFHKGLNLIMPKKKDGLWLHENPLDGYGFVEANGWQATFGLSHDIPTLAKLMGGNAVLTGMLDSAFQKSAAMDFVYGYNQGYVSYANQPGCSNAHVFAHAGKPWLSQYWVRRVKEQAYGAITPDKGYGGHDEDQGQMGAISALMAIGLFSIDGGSSAIPRYDITAPVFDEVTINLNRSYYGGTAFKIRVHGNSAENCYIQKAVLNGKTYTSFQILHEDLVKGGTLELWLGNKPNKKWGLK
ncbi:GH92 family glycosyl hydrolase [Sphingobacterium sp. Mn56C]|uniref:GH92 family glycosyl hydrolase n=1 Tax=Sphingobacterium sp. Mn56C TaxID=3395261 RepID=UPI003BF4D3BB